MRICVFGAASFTIDKKYIEATEKMGEAFAKRGHDMVFGAGANGLMGAAARGFKRGGAHIIGVIPKFFEGENVEEIFEGCDELIMPETMRDRKQIMEDNADAFVVVPGGIGTYEEFFEILTLKQLCRHSKPIVLFNQFGYYNELQATLESAVAKEFIKDNCMQLYFVSEDIDEVIAYVEKPNEGTYTIKDFKNG